MRHCPQERQELKSKIPQIDSFWSCFGKCVDHFRVLFVVLRPKRECSLGAKYYSNKTIFGTILTQIGVIKVERTVGTRASGSLTTVKRPSHTVYDWNRQLLLMVSGSQKTVRRPSQEDILTIRDIVAPHLKQQQPQYKKTKYYLRPTYQGLHNHILWKCSKTSSLKCSANFTTSLELVGPNVWSKLNRNHSHLLNENLVIAQKIKCNMKQQTKITSRLPGQIFSE
ncbi:FLYWCH-type domain-containing protein, partial [Aphis craccivora]